MQAKDVLGYVMTFLSFLSTIYAIYEKPEGTGTIILVVCAVICAITLFILLLSEQNKMYTLQVLSRENRNLSLRLLLLYNRLLRSQDEITSKFQASRLIVSNAVYRYSIINKKRDADPLKDVECVFTFTIKRAVRTKIHAIIVQDRGSTIQKLTYNFDKSGETPVRLTPISITSSTKGTNFMGFYRAEITLPKRILLCSKERRPSLVVKFRLGKTYNTNSNYQPFLICPFIYAKKMRAFKIELDCSGLPIALRPNVVNLFYYPYDGTRYMPNHVANFPAPQDGVWKKNVARCHTSAIYFLEPTRSEETQE